MLINIPKKKRQERGRGYIAIILELDVHCLCFLPFKRVGCNSVVPALGNSCRSLHVLRVQFPHGKSKRAKIQGKEREKSDNILGHHHKGQVQRPNGPKVESTWKKCEASKNVRRTANA